MLLDDVLDEGLLLLLVLLFLQEYEVTNALVLAKLLLGETMLGDQALCFDIDYELGPFTNLAFNMNRASHLLNNLLAYR